MESRAVMVGKWTVVVSVTELSHEGIKVELRKYT